MAFDYAFGKTTLGELELHGVHHEETGTFQLTAVTIEGQLVIPSRSFVKSLCERFAISQTVQCQRTSGELLSLLVRSFPQAQIEYRVEWDESGTTWLFAGEPVAPELPVEGLDDIPSPDSRLEQYGFKPAAKPTAASRSDDDQDWPLLRDTGCHVPTFPVLPGDTQTETHLFVASPIGTPRPSVN